MSRAPGLRAAGSLLVVSVFVLGAVAGMLVVIVGVGDRLPSIEAPPTTTTTTTAQAVEMQRVRPCDDLDGFVVNDLTAIPTCVDADDVIYHSPSAVRRCGEGLVIWWSEVAWGYLGRPAHLVSEDAPYLVPEWDWASCIQAAADDKG